MNNNSMANLKTNEQGAVLIVALIMLLVLTIIGVAVMESSVIEEKMAGNFSDRNEAFQAAEFSLRNAENWLANVSEAPIAGTGRVKKHDALASPGVSNWWGGRDKAWWVTNGQDTLVSITNAEDNPHYVIEEYDEVCDGDQIIESECAFVFRITAVAWGGKNTQVILQSLYSRRF